MHKNFWWCVTVFLLGLSLNSLFAMDEAKKKLPFDYGEKNIAQPLFLYDSDGNYAVPVYSVKEFVLQLWRVDERDHVPAFLHETQEKITFAAISSDGTGLLTSLDRSLKIWRIFEQKLEFAAVYQHTFPITQLALSQDGKTAVIQDAQGLFIVLQVADKKFEIIAKLEQKESGLSAIFSFTNSGVNSYSASKIAIHPKGSAFIAGDPAGNIASYLISLGTIVPLPKVKIFHDQRITGLAFTSDHTIIVGGQKGGIESYPWSNGVLNEPQVLRAGSETPQRQASHARIMVSSDGQKALTRDKDGTILLWIQKAGLWLRSKELVHPQLSGYQDGFFSYNVPMLWSADNDRAIAITKY